VRNVALEVKLRFSLYAVQSSGESEGVGRTALVAPLGVLPWFVAGLAGAGDGVHDGFACDIVEVRQARQIAFRKAAVGRRGGVQGMVLVECR